MDLTEQINTLYLSCREDSTPLFQTILEVSDTIGLIPALKILEKCVLTKRMAWYDQVGSKLKTTGDPLKDGFHLFYEKYLNVNIPEHGTIIHADQEYIQGRWINTCSTLYACQKLGLDTRIVCRTVYHAPVQALLTRVDPRLRFERNYACIRPYCDYCEETIRITAV